MLIKLIAGAWYTQVSPGVSPGFIFSENGAITTGKYFRVGSATSEKTGQPIFGRNKLVKLRISNSVNVGNDTVVQLQKRTGLTTFVDITGASITIPSGHYTSTAQVDIILDDNVEISAYNKSGSTIYDPVLILFLLPR